MLQLNLGGNMTAVKKRKKKYNPANRKSRAQMLDSAMRVFDVAWAKERQRTLDEKELAIRQAAMGTTLSFNSSWDNDSEFHPSNFSALMGILNDNLDATCGVLVTWHFDWEVVLTIYYRDQDGEPYEKFLRLQFEMLPMCTPEGQPDGPGKMIGVEDLLEHEYLTKIRKTANPNHIEESWGYFATIIYI